MHDFTDIAYLQNGPAFHQQVYDLLTRRQLLSGLNAFSPVFAGSIPIAVHTAGSDIDIICCFDNKDLFISCVRELFQQYPGFALREITIREIPAVVANFTVDGQPVEVFGQAIPVKEQMAYRHLLIEAAILQQRGEDFRRQVISLKEQGYNTEAAFCHLLGIPGDPFLELLKWAH
nr:DUF4269 domain-containing protein [uncultured Chitinophaga sp.]